MDKKYVLKELEVFNDIFLREEDHTYLFKGEDIGFRSVSYLKDKYKKKAPWGKIKQAISERDGITIEEIEAAWALNGDIGRQRGTYVHKYCENRFNGLSVKDSIPDLPEIVLKLTPDRLLQFAKETKMMIQAAEAYVQYLYDIGATPVAQEVTVFNSLAKISGTFDLMYIDAFGRLHIADFKTDREFTCPTDRYKGKARMTGPMKAHYNCKQVIYSLQQCLYRKMVEDSTDLEIPTDHIHLIHLGMDGNFKDFRCIDMREESEQIMQIQIDLNFEPQF